MECISQLLVHNELSPDLAVWKQTPFSHRFCGSGIQEQLSWEILVCSLSRGRSWIKAGLRLEELWPRWLWAGGFIYSLWDLLHGATWMFLPADASRLSDPRQRGGSHSGFVDFISETTNYHFCHIPFIASEPLRAPEGIRPHLLKGGDVYKKIVDSFKNYRLSDAAEIPYCLRTVFSGWGGVHDEEPTTGLPCCYRNWHKLRSARWGHLILLGAEGPTGMS